MASLDLTNALGGAGAADAPGIDLLLVITIGVVAAALIVLIAIAVANWRAARALKTVRENWAKEMALPGRRLTHERTVKPNPLRK